MNQGFKLKFDRMQEGNPAKEGSETASPSTVIGDKYFDAGYVRNICFVFLTGKRIFLNYSYLVSCDYDPQESIIRLQFTTHFVVLKGIQLEVLYYDIMLQITRQVICVDARYNDLGMENASIVNEIVVTESTS